MAGPACRTKGVLLMGNRFPKKVACVFCTGGSRATGCEYGCTGCESCVKACKKDAIHINSFGVAEVDAEKCVNCGLCIKACPKQLIRSRLYDAYYMPLCSNNAIGREAKDQCQFSCIACGACVKNCPCGAVSIVDNCAVIDDENCLNCGFCAVNCPRRVILDMSGIITVRA